MVAGELAGAFETLANGILDFVNYGITILAIMFVIEAVKLFGLGGIHKAGGKLGGKLFGLAKSKGHIPFTKEHQHKYQKRLTSEYIMEEREEKELDNLRSEVHRILGRLEAVRTSGKFNNFSEMNVLRKKIHRFGDKINSSKRTFRRLKRATFRADARLDRFLKWAKDHGKKIPEKVKALENNILKLHQETAEELVQVENVYGGIRKSQSMVVLDALNKDNFNDPKFGFTVAHSNDLITKFKQEFFELKQAYEKQAQAKRDLQGVVSELRDVYGA